MNEPLFWNPLPAAAAWLSKRTGREIDALALVDTVASMGKQGDRGPTIIKAMMPRELQFAAITSQAYQDTNQSMAKQMGPLPLGFVYVAPAYPTVAPLCVNDLLELLMHGCKDVTVLPNTPTTSPNHFVWVMPWGTAHRATVQTCGINRADLFALGELLVTPTAPATQADTPPAPVVETKEQRQDRRLKACEAAGLKMDSRALHRLPDGVGDVADREGVTRQAFSTDIKAALKRREVVTKPGRIVRFN